MRSSSQYIASFWIAATEPCMSQKVTSWNTTIREEECAAQVQLPRHLNDVVLVISGTSLHSSLSLWINKWNLWLIALWRCSLSLMACYLPLSTSDTPGSVSSWVSERKALSRVKTSRACWHDKENGRKWWGFVAFTPFVYMGMVPGTAPNRHQSKKNSNHNMCC